jgi:hypothetical protein
MMFQGMQRAMQQQPQGPGQVPPQGARPPMPGGQGGQPAAPWQGMGNGWLQQLRGMGAQMGQQQGPMGPPQGSPDPTVRGPGAMQNGRPDPVMQQAQATAQQGQQIAQQQGRGLIAQDDPRMRGMTR